MPQEFAARLLWRDPQTLPAPTQAIESAVRFLTLTELVWDIGISLGRILAGFADGWKRRAGVAIGLLCGSSRLFNALTIPFIEFLRPIPPLAWIPIAIIWFGLGETSKIFVVFLGAFFPIFTGAWRGMRLVPPVLLQAAQTMDVRGLRLFVKVILPAALPDIVTGLRVGFGLSFGILVAAELIAADYGMGHLVMEASVNFGQLGVSFFGIFLIGIINLLIDYGNRPRNPQHGRSLESEIRVKVKQKTVEGSGHG